MIFLSVVVCEFNVVHGIWKHVKNASFTSIIKLVTQGHDNYRIVFYGSSVVLGKQNQPICVT